MADLDVSHDMVLRKIKRFPPREEVIHIRFSSQQIPNSRTIEPKGRQLTISSTHLSLPCKCRPPMQYPPIIEDCHVSAPPNNPRCLNERSTYSMVAPAPAETNTPTSPSSGSLPISSPRCRTPFHAGYHVMAEQLDHHCSTLPALSDFDILTSLPAL